MTHRADAIDMLDALSREAAFAAAECDSRPSDTESHDVQAALAFARRELARQARADVAPAAAVVRPVRPSILAMSRDAVIARLRELQAAAGGAPLAVSHRHFAGDISDADLRTMLEDLEATFAPAGIVR